MSDLQRKLWNAGFQLLATGGGFNAYAKPLFGNRYVLLCDNNNQVDDISDDDFIVGLEEEGSPLVCILRHGDVSTVRVEAYEPVTLTDSDRSTIKGALASVGVQI